MSENQTKEISIQEIAFNIFLFFKRYFKLHLIFGIIGISIGVLMYFSSNPEYQSQMIAMSNVDKWHNDELKFSTTDEIISLINSLNTTILEGSYVTLAQNLNISEQSAKHILLIEASYHYPYELKIKEDENPPASNYFKVNVSVNNNQILDSLSSSIQDYITKNEYFSTKQSRRLNALHEINAKLAVEQHSVDSMRGNFYRLKMDDFTILGNQSYSNESMSLFAQQINNKLTSEELFLFKILTPFYVSETNHNSLPKKVVIWGAISVFMAIYFRFSYTSISWQKSTINSNKNREETWFIIK